ncbi:MAG: DNA gyrase subunit B, partial [Deltaproteobacteria bacterium]|nr:DNA gyrase subunit B [Deltaproteobacteria bacterium]
GDLAKLNEAVVNYNHKIKEIIWLDKKIDVYDIEVPETHNFALACGVFVHNSAKQGRDRKNQAILPLKGKILNVEKARFDKIISFEEIRLLISALGTGIGSEEYNISSLRYHKIIIMTDADVDGAHIRTLLLTFFYRQMPEIIERGYLYIAQPPLYKVKKGKEEKYLKTDVSLHDFLLETALEEITLNSQDSKNSVHGKKIKATIQNLIEYNKILWNTRKKRDSQIVSELILNGKTDRTCLDSEKKCKSFMEELKKQMESKHEDVQSLEYEISKDEEHDCCKVSIKITQGNYTKKMTLDHEFLSSPEFKELQKLGKVFELIGLPPWFIEKKDKATVECKTTSALVDEILKIGKEELASFQRYKGLGEMNPPQLWETTMNPKTRTLLQVSIEDAVEADSMFTVLMGDEVAPRRQFIEENALKVRNLDV